MPAFIEYRTAAIAVHDVSAPTFRLPEASLRVSVPLPFARVAQALAAASQPHAFASSPVKLNGGNSAWLPRPV
jgi:hypothetical protein